jgi:hypothetical protein
MISETHLTATFDVGSRKVRVLDVPFPVATCLVRGTVCVTGMVVWINIHSSAVCVCVCVCVTGHRSGYYQWGLWLSQPVNTCSLYFHKWTYYIVHFPSVTELKTSTLHSISASGMEGTCFKLRSRQGLPLLGFVAVFLSAPTWISQWRNVDT